MRKFIVPLLFCVLFLALFGAVFLAPAAQASVPQPLLAPTPVAVQPVAPSKIVFPIFSGVITQALRVEPINFRNMRIADIQYVLDVTDEQTVTARLDYSNDGSNWVSGPTLINAAVADGTDMQEYYTFGGVGSVTFTLGTTNPVTVSVYAAGQ